MRVTPSFLRRVAAATLLAALLPRVEATAQELHWTSHGAARTVSGSMHLLQWGATRMLLDCGTYFSDEAAVELPGGPPVDELNTQLPFDPNGLDFAVLSHAHLDHSGRLPLLLRSGWRGPIYATPATVALCRHMLAMPLRYGPLPAEILYRARGSKLLHGDARCSRLERGGRPLAVRATRQALAGTGLSMCQDCVEDELERLMLLFRPVEYGRWEDVAPGVRLRFSDAGHIAGAAVTELELGKTRTLVFSGDLGAQMELLVKTPRPPQRAETAVVEATYGAAVRSVPQPPYSDFEEALAAAAAKGEPVVVIAYTLDRTQRVLYLIRRLQAQGRLARDVPVTMPSPSAHAATAIYSRLLDVFGEKYFAAALVGFARAQDAAFAPPGLRRRDEGGVRGIFVIPAGLEFSKTGQAILARLVGNPRAHIYSVGYADRASIAGKLLAGEAPTLNGTTVPLRAEVRKFSVFTGHADADEMLGWLRGIEGLRRVVVVHGEPASCDALAARVRAELGVRTLVPERGIRLSLQD